MFRKEKTDIRIDQGARYRHHFPVEYSNGDPFDLTGYTAASQIREQQRDDSDLIYTADVQISSNTVILDIPHTDTEDFAFDLAYYDIEVYDLQGRAYRIAQGRVILNRQVTRIEDTD